MVAMDSVFPVPSELIELEPEELGAFLLRFAAHNIEPDGSFSRYNLIGAGSNQLSDYCRETGLRTTVQRVLEEGLSWLEREGLVVQIATTNGDRFFISRLGQSLKDSSQLNAFKRASLLGRSTLLPALAQKVTSLFSSGDYDTAVFRAFKLVEVRTRAALRSAGSAIQPRLGGRQANA